MAARLACSYCGHALCHATASYVTRDQIAPTATTTAPAARNSWADREHTTWLEKL